MEWLGFDYCLNTAHLTRLQSHLDSMWMIGRVSEDIFHYTTCKLSGSLVHLLDNINCIPQMDITALRSPIQDCLAPFIGDGFYRDYIPTHFCKWHFVLFQVVRYWWAHNAKGLAFSREKFYQYCAFMAWERLLGHVLPSVWYYSELGLFLVTVFPRPIIA